MWVCCDCHIDSEAFAALDRFCHPVFSDTVSVSATDDVGEAIMTKRPKPEKLRVVVHQGTTITVDNTISQLQVGDVLVLKRKGVIARFIRKMIEWWER